jgi:hypothetical protein
MFGFSSNQKSTSSTSWASDGGDQLVVEDADGFVLRFEPYPEMSTPQPSPEWRTGDPEWAHDLWGYEVDESDPQPGYDDHDHDDS